MRTLQLANPLMRGNDVKKLQRALAAAGLLGKEDVDGVYGPATARACELAKWRLGYPARGIHRGRETAGETLLALLQGKKRLPVAYRARRRVRLAAAARKAAKATTSRAVLASRRETVDRERRDRVAALARWAVAHEPDVHYAQQRPMELPPVKRLPWSTDCSEFVTTLYRWAGCPDPNGCGYDGSGYTGTLLAHLRPVPVRLVEKADLVVYGAAPGHHVCVVVEAGADPLLVSHGQERGPLLIRHSEEARYQPSHVTWLKGVMQ